MKHIRTKSYLKFAQFGGYPPGVTGHESYFQDSADDVMGTETFPIMSNGKQIYVTAKYTVDMNNIGLGDQPDISIDNIIKIVDENNHIITDFELNDDEIQQIKDIIIENGDWNYSDGIDTREEERGEV